MRQKNLISLLLTLITLVSYSQQKNILLAKTPPMGWNSWNTFETNIDEKLVKETADIMVASGMKDAGYTYIVLDDGWMTRERDTNGNLVPDPIKFPSGMKALADYVHSKGLKIGIYSDAGATTCAGRPGSRGHEYRLGPAPDATCDGRAPARAACAPAVSHGSYVEHG